MSNHLGPKSLTSGHLKNRPGLVVQKVQRFPVHVHPQSSKMLLTGILASSTTGVMLAMYKCEYITYIRAYTVYSMYMLYQNVHIKYDLDVHCH